MFKDDAQVDVYKNRFKSAQHWQRLVYGNAIDILNRC